MTSTRKENEVGTMNRKLKSMLAVSIVSFITAIMLVIIIPHLINLVQIQLHDSAFRFFLVKIYIYAIPLAYVLLGVSLIIIRNALVEDREAAI